MIDTTMRLWLLWPTCPSCVASWARGDVASAPIRARGRCAILTPYPICDAECGVIRGGKGQKFHRNWAATWRRELRRQYVRQPRRCQRSSVSDFTTRREALNQRHAKIQKRRSTSSRRGCSLRRCRTTSCCRRQKLSAICSAFGWLGNRNKRPKQTAQHCLSLLLNRQEADVVQCRQWKWPLRLTILRWLFGTLFPARSVRRFDPPSVPLSRK
jgi:hypothetical protein